MMYLFIFFSRINCFSFNSTPLKCFKITRTIRARLITECRPCRNSISSGSKVDNACRKDRKMEIRPRKLRLRVMRMTCQWRNLVRWESSNCLCSQTCWGRWLTLASISSREYPSKNIQRLFSSSLFLCLLLVHCEQISFLYFDTGSSSNIQNQLYKSHQDEYYYIIYDSQIKPPPTTITTTTTTIYIYLIVIYKASKPMNNTELKHDQDKGAFVSVEASHGDHPQHYSEESARSLPEEIRIDESNQEELAQPEDQFQHVISSEEQEGYYCMTCNKSYNIRICPCTNMKFQKRKYKCTKNDCQLSFRNELGLERHTLVHEGIKPFECDYHDCDQRFTQKSNLNRHKRIHTKEKPFICQTCTKSFTTTTNLKQHVQVHLSDRDRRRKYICQLKGCNKEYLYQCNLKKHKKEHDDPLGECLVEKKPDHPIFSITIGNCSFRIAYKNSKEHSEMVMTYLDNITNSIKYNMDNFESILEDVAEERKMEELIEEHLEELDRVMRKMLEETKNLLNIGFQMHKDMCPIANLLTKTLVNILGETNLKVFTLIIPYFSAFKDVVNNLITEFEWEE